MKACPFCGKKPTLDHDMVYCRDRGCPGYDADAPIAAWNRRAPAPEAERLRDLLRTVEELHGKATKGPWSTYCEPSTPHPEAAPEYGIDGPSARFKDLLRAPVLDEMARNKANVEFIVALRNLCPALLALARGEESEGGK